MTARNGLAYQIEQSGKKLLAQFSITAMAA